MYNHKKIELKWRKKWENSGIYKTREDVNKKKYYILDMFPYPSGAGLHVGHPKGYIATDIFARFKRMQGFNVLHPMGWDAFGLPAENFALKNKTHPKRQTEENIAMYKSQLAKLGFSYDWDREINTTDPEFYKWTQWTFLKMFEKGLAYESYEPIIWCPTCKTGLANEDLEGDKCERCGTLVERKPMRQWVLRITNYADRMLKDLDKLPNWDDSIREMQRNWIGRSVGAEVKFKVIDKEGDNEVKVFTTRPDTLFGCTYMVLSPEHKLVQKMKDSIKNFDEVEKYIKTVGSKSDLERTDLAKEKTGVELKGVKAINPVNGEEVSVWIADYVLATYGTGAIMAVPAHDERDFEFAKKYGIEIRNVVVPYFVSKKDSILEIKKDILTKKRNVVYVLVKNPKTSQFLLLKWPEYKCSTYVIGGINKDEDIIEAGKREVLEETGYKNLKFIKEIGSEVHANYYAMHKNENRYAIARCMYYELENEEQIEISEEEKNKHEVVWVSEEDVDKDMIYGNITYFWDIFKNGEKVYCGDGVNINSNFLNGLETKDAKEKIINWLEEKNLGKEAVNYKLNDWVFSRQRYWGEPIPIIHCDKCGAVGVPEEELPLKLPDVEKYEPTGTGESPLAGIDEWVNTKCPKCGGDAKRETNTMPQWAGSSWYYLRFVDPKNNEQLVNKDKDKYWSPVDFYVGGAEHATRHLIYARFWHKFLYDIGVVNYEEPFTRLQQVGLVLAEDGRKMSKRWGNVINPDDIVEEFGADAMRLYEMFMSPFSQSCSWSTKGLIGTRRFLEKVCKISENLSDNIALTQDRDVNKVEKILHKTIKKVTEDINEFKFNTAISQMMILVNEMMKNKVNKIDDFEKLLKILASFIPHLAEELWEKLGHNTSIFDEKWPIFDEKLIIDQEFELIIQVNGKIRDRILISKEVQREEIEKIALKSENIQKWIDGKDVLKLVFVPGKLINVVVG